MDLLDQLVAYYGFEQRFEEEMHAVDSVPPGNNLRPQIDFMHVQSTEGVVGNAARFNNADGPDMYHVQNDVFAAAGKDKTIAFWLRITGWPQPMIFMNDGGDYRLSVDDVTHKLFAEGTAGTGVVHSKVLERDTWYFVVIFFDVSAGTVGVRFNNEVPQVGAITLGGNGDFSLGGGVLQGDIDELGFWNRILTGAEMDWLYNDGNGRSYDDIVEESSPGNCRELTCCSD